MEVRCFSLSNCSHEFISTHHTLHSSQILLVLVVDTIEKAAAFTGLRFPIQPVILKAWPYIWRARVSPRLARVGLGMVLRPGSEGHIISAGPPALRTTLRALQHLQLRYVPRAPDSIIQGVSGLPSTSSNSPICPSNL